ncbi:MAG: hypothetical protein ABJC63_00010 [Gemmatimonadales bacterium]
MTRLLNDKWFPWAVGVLAAAYLIQIVTPLRLDHDSVLYFRIAMSFADHTPRPDIGLPNGFPLLIVFLERLGFAVKTALVLLGVLSIFAGLLGAWAAMDKVDVRVRRIAIVMTLLCFSVIRAAVVPEPDAIYFGLSLLAVGAMQRATDPAARQRYVLLVIAVALTTLAGTLRSAGVAMIPALLCSVWMTVTLEAGRDLRRRIQFAMALMLGVALLAGVSFGVVNGSLGSYAGSALQGYSAGTGLSHVWKRFGGTVNRFGELSLNVPALKYPIIRPLERYPGPAVAILLLIYARTLRRIDPLVVYVACYMGMLIVWPFDAIRLWIPILPFLIAVVAKALLDLDRFRVVAVMSRLWLAWMIVIGLGAIAYTTRISFSGKNFPLRYGLRGGLASPGEEARNPLHDLSALRIIARYDADQAELRRALPVDR